MAKLLFQGHGSMRLTTNDGRVIYIDPFAGSGYEVPADLILVTHQHRDHNQIQLPNKKPDCIIIQNFDALRNGEYQQFELAGVTVQAVPAENSNHKREECVGYLVIADDKLLYFAGDTSIIPEMYEYSKLHIDYAFLPTDGIYNMNAEEASRCAELIGAMHAVPIHMNPTKLFDVEVTQRFTAVNRLIIEAGEEIDL